MQNLEALQITGGSAEMQYQGRKSALLACLEQTSI
jgi:hypothetical protein